MVDTDDVILSTTCTATGKLSKLQLRERLHDIVSGA